MLPLTKSFESAGPLERAGPEWIRQQPLRATSKGAKLRRQESLRGDRNLARNVTNESIDQNSSQAFASKLGLRPTLKGQMLTRGLSIREHNQRGLRSGSGLSRSGSNTSSTGSGSSFRAAKERRGGVKKESSIRLKKKPSIRSQHLSGLSRSSSNGSSSIDEEALMLPKGSIGRGKRLQKESSANMKRQGSFRVTRGHPSGLSRSSSNGSSSIDEEALMLPKGSIGRGKRLQKESSVNMKRQGSFRVTRGDLDMTLNVVKVEAETPAWCRPTVLRTTSRGARLMRGESIRRGKKQPAASPEQTMFADFHDSMDQLGASVAEMGFFLEVANDEE